MVVVPPPQHLTTSQPRNLTTSPPSSFIPADKCRQFAGHGLPPETDKFRQTIAADADRYFSYQQWSRVLAHGCADLGAGHVEKLARQIFHTVGHLGQRRQAGVATIRLVAAPH